MELNETFLYADADVMRTEHPNRRHITSSQLAVAVTTIQKIIAKLFVSHRIITHMWINRIMQFALHERTNEQNEKNCAKMC